MKPVQIKSVLSNQEFNMAAGMLFGNDSRARTGPHYTRSRLFQKELL